MNIKPRHCILKTGGTFDWDYKHLIWCIKDTLIRLAGSPGSVYTETARTGCCIFRPAKNN